MNLHRPIALEEQAARGRDPRARPRAGRRLPADGVAARRASWGFAAKC